MRYDNMISTAVRVRLSIEVALGGGCPGRSAPMRF